MTLSIGAHGQCLIQTVDGGCYWTDTPITGMMTEVTVEFANQKILIPTNEIAVVVDMTDGIDIRKPNSLTTVEAIAYNGQIDEFLASGKRVFVPITSYIVEQRWGARRLAELLMRDGYWRLVTTPEQADFILEYQYTEQGLDKAFLKFSDRYGHSVILSNSIGARNYNPKEAGKESAELLYNKYIVKGLYKGIYDGWKVNSLNFFIKPSLSISTAEKYYEHKQIEISPLISIGYKINRQFLIGIGTGYYTITHIPDTWYYKTITAIPIFGDIRFNFTPRPNTIYADFMISKIFTNKFYEDKNWYKPKIETTWEWYLGLGFGIRDVDICLFIGQRYFSYNMNDKITTFDRIHFGTRINYSISLNRTHK